MLTSAHIRKVGSVSFCVAAVLLSLCLAAPASAAGIKVVPSAPKVSPGENFFIDIVVENIPSDGLGAVQFRLNVNAPGSIVAAVSDTAFGKTSEVSVVTPLLVGPATASRSGIGEFFWNATGPHGILVMDNETLKNGSGLYTFGHTNGAVPPQGSGAIARFLFAVGKDVEAEKIDVTLSDVVLLDTGVVYPLESNIGATIDLKCNTMLPNLLGLSLTQAQVALEQASLTVGRIYELNNWDGTHSLNIVLAQSHSEGTAILCETPIDLAVNIAPSEVGNAVASDKAGDETGTVTITYLPSASADAAGYRVYLVSSGVRLTEVGNPATTSVEITGLVNSQATQVRITAYDTYGNESQGVVISATALDDVAPRVSITGVSDGEFYASDVQPAVEIQDANLAATEITLNGTPYTLTLISLEADYTLKVTATDHSGNTTTKQVGFAVDKTAPVITVTGIEKGKYYNADLAPVITVSDAHLLSAESLLNGSAYTSGSAITAEASYELTVTALDKAGNSSSDSYTFFIDKTKPTSDIAVGDPKFMNNDVTFIAGATPLTLAGADAGVVVSGIERLEYMINTDEWTLYQAPFALSGLADGDTSVTYRAVDRAGNIEEFHTVSYIVDNTPPDTEITAGDPKYSAADGTLYVAGSTVFTLAGSDSLSGVALTEYRIDNGEWQAYAPFTLPAEGTHIIGYRSSDNLGNPETEKTLTANVDSTPPVTTITVGDPKHTAADGTLYVTASTQFALSATDSLSGVVRTEYRLDGGDWTAYALFSISGEGSHTIEYRSQDNVLNLESAGALTVVVDNTPPVTTITTGDPKHTAADGTLYVTASTQFALSATDRLSGVARTEYRIDGGDWTAYAPFSIAADGSHTIEYRSQDNVLNLESAGALTIVVDNTPPVSTVAVGNPQYTSEGKLYVSGSTGITIVAEDALSGVGTTEYKVDSGSWTPYTSTFTLSVYSDGEHIISYRSIDNVGNVETAKELTVVLDKTPPVTAITASDPLTEGRINTISPVTLFTLIATDNLSGIRATSYRIDDGTWQTYTSSFSLAGMSAGQHTIAYKATDNVLNEETEKSITVKLIILEVKKGMPSDSVVLVGVWSDNSDRAQKQADTKTLENLLSSIGVTYFIAPDMAEFTKALRSGRYNTYILIDVKEPLIGEEVREAVNFGDGLIFIKTSPQADPFLDDVFGVKFLGKTTDSNLTVNVAESPISNEGTLDNAGKNVVANITSTTAQGFASVTDKHNTYPVIVFNQYGRGRALLYAFDVLAVSDQAKAAALMVNSINYVRPIEQYPRPLASVPVRITLTNSTEQIDVKVKEILPAGLLADTISPSSSQVENTITWDKSLQPLQKTTFGYYLNLPDLAGEFATETEVRYRNLGEYRLYGLNDLTLHIRLDSKDLLQEILGDLNSIVSPGIEDAARIAKAKDELMKIDAQASLPKDAEQSIQHILNAANEVRALSVDATMVRLKLDELLKIWEKKWHLMVLEN